MLQLNHIQIMTSEIIVSLITSVITWTVLIFGKNVIIPFYETIVYKGILVSGTWTHTSTLHQGTHDETTYTEKLFLKQSASSIEGNYTVVSLFKDNTQVVSTYDIKGRVKDGYIVLTANIQDQKQIGCGSFVLKVISGGQKLFGNVTLLNRLADNIVTYPNCTYNKDV